MKEFTQRFWTIQETDNGCQLLYKSKPIGTVILQNDIPFASIDSLVAINYCDLDDLKNVLEVACKYFHHL